MIINCMFGVQACFEYNIKVTKLGMYDMKSLKFATVLFTSSSYEWASVREPADINNILCFPPNNRLIFNEIITNQD